MKAILDTRADSGYDDDITRRYHFPDRYLSEAQKALDDWIVYREPRRGHGREGYVAVARLTRIEPDENRSRFSFGYISDFLPFDTVVPLRTGGGFYEQTLNDVQNASRVGAALQGKSIRTMSDIEFGAIVRDGLGETLNLQNKIRVDPDPSHPDYDFDAFTHAPALEQMRKITSMLTNRKLRDAAFRRAVCDAYEDTCAVTRLKIINGGGRAEVQAAHIRSVADHGPDVVQNGLALSATAHWLFDRHLISLTDDLGLLVSHNRIPGEFRGLFERQLARIHLPTDRKFWPHSAYVRRHREMFFGSQ